MANEPIVTIVGNLVRDPEVRTTRSGTTVATFTIASTPRNYRRDTQQWEDGETLFMRCSAWRELGENVIETLTKGTRVIVQGRLTQSSWTTQDGQKQTSVELTVDEVGPSLRYAVAQVTKTSGGAGGGNRTDNYSARNDSFGGQQGGYGEPSHSFGAPLGGSQDDPWSSNSAFDSAPPY